jgi:DNA-binding transcriptional regulator YhcF (GntR family)
VPWIDRVGVKIDRQADVPVGVQLGWALGGAIRSGALGPGDRLPPLRELAEELGVNPNTLRAVYARLEADGLIETRHGSGTYVRHGWVGTDIRELNDLVDTATRAARDAGVDPRALAAALYVTPGTPPARDAEAEQRRRVRDEIDVLEQVLARYPHAPAPTARSKGPRLLSLTELEAERDALVARLAAAAQPAPEEEPAAKPRAKKAAKAPARGAAKRGAKPRLGPATA